MGVNVLTWNIETQTYDLPDWHRRQLNKKLVEEYPFLLPRMLSTDTISDDYDYQYTLFDDIPSGWREEFGIEMCEEIKKVLEKYDMLKDYRIFQIKEKFGELRVYGNWGNEEFDSVIKKYTDYSKIICYRCGDRANFYDMYKTGCPICHHCAEELDKQNHLCLDLLIPIDFYLEELKQNKSLKQICKEHKERRKD